MQNYPKLKTKTARERHENKIKKLRDEIQYLEEKYDKLTEEINNIMKVSKKIQEDGFSLV